MNRISTKTISALFKRYLQRKELVTQEDTSLIFMDLSCIDDKIQELIALFPHNTLHAAAIKANPLFKLTQYISKRGLGAEVASLAELHLAKQAGILVEKIVFDSPAKTFDELKYALSIGCHINADSLQELDRIASLKQTISSSSTIGLRVNPQVGVGNIEISSTAGVYSKFGVSINQNKEAIKSYYKKYDWLSGIHLHIGSQGCPLELFIRGIKIVLDLTLEINSDTNQQINIFDIGGGIPIHFSDQEHVSFSLQMFVNALKANFSDLFNDKFKLITEFGRVLYSNAGWTISKVEYVKKEQDLSTVIIHVGADLFLRRCTYPNDWPHEFIVLSKTGDIKKSDSLNKYTIAGPLCYAGDIVAKEIELPEVQPGDYIVIKDTGGYTLGMWSRYLSRQTPKVIGYTDDEEFQILKERESIESVINSW